MSDKKQKKPQTFPDEADLAPDAEALPEELREKAYTDEDGKPDEKYYTHAEYYHMTKEKEILRLEQEIKDKAGRDTKKQRRSWWIKTTLMLLLIALSIGIMFGMNSYLSDGNTKSFSEIIQSVNWGFFALLVGVIVFYMLVESAKYAYLLKISTGKFRFRVSLKTMYLGKYYDGITPLATGGQPFQIYYLHKKKIPAGVATAIPLVRFIVTTFVFCALGIIVLAVSPLFIAIDAATKVFYIIAWIALGLNLCIPMLIILVTLFPRFGRKLIALIVSLLSKIRIVRHKYPTMKKYITEIDEYNNAFKVLIRRWWKLIPLVLLALLESVVNLAIPFFTILAIGGPSVSDDLFLLFLQTVCLSMISFYSVSLIPTPGNSGASEFSSTFVFSTLSKTVSGFIGWMVFLWRFTTYYVYILSGIGISIFEIIRSAVRNKRAAKKEKEAQNQTQG